MNWDHDLDFLSGQKPVVKQGRRAALQNTESSSENLLDLPPEDEKPVAPIRTRKTGGWADEGNKLTKNKSSTNLIEQERFQDTNKYESDDDIPVIPDIEDLQDEPTHLQETRVPSVSVNRQTYKELDSELKYLQSNQSSIAKLGDINLSFLTDKLYAEKDVKDPDTVWTMESLFNNLKSLKRN